MLYDFIAASMNNFHRFNRAMIWVVLFSVALGSGTFCKAQAEDSNYQIVIEEADAIDRDMLSGGILRLQSNWNVCMKNAIVTRSKSVANRCLLYTLGAMDIDPGFGGHNTDEALATEQNVTLAINVLLQIIGLSTDAGNKYIVAEKPILESELLKDVNKGLSDAPPVMSTPQDDVASIPLTSENGIFTVPATINGVLNINFLVDTGASDVNIPVDVFLTLYRTGSISQADFVGTQSSMLADGTIIPSEVFMIRQLQVGDKIATNVLASVGSANSTLLLGESFLRQFSSWSIDNQNHILYLK